LLDTLAAKQACGRHNISIDGPFWWVKVKGNRLRGVEPCYDIEVPSTGTFVVEGLMTHNSSGYVSAKATDYYSRHGQFYLLLHFGERAYGGEFAGVRLNLLQTDGAKFLRGPLDLGSWALRCFLRRLLTAEERIEELEGLTREGQLSPWEWPCCQHELACYGRYGKCEGWDLCQEGPSAVLGRGSERGE
jgi:hypothetical protein